MTLVGLFACSGSSSTASPSDAGILDGEVPYDGGAPCNTKGDCLPWGCLCNDGSSLGDAIMCVDHVCYHGTGSDCSSQCAANGGLACIGYFPNVADSSECAAFCGKVLSLSCPGATDMLGCQNLDCFIPAGACAASTRALLQCEADHGAFMCLDAGGWSQQAPGCGTFSSLCGDGGAAAD